MKILLGICGSIAAVKSPEIIRLLSKRGHHVTPLLTRSAEQFVTSTSLTTLAQTPVITETGPFLLDQYHISLSKTHDLLLIAPCTANTLSKLATGAASDKLSDCFLMFKGPVILAPAMHTEMWENPRVQENIKCLQAQGVRILNPTEGDLSSGDTGVGRLMDPELLVELALQGLKPPLNLGVKKILITAGGTQEPIDPVRCITNHASGKLGEALAHLAYSYGAEVTLISTKPLMHSSGITHISVDTAESVSHAVNTHFPESDCLIMTAAISDFTPPVSPTKIRRSQALSLNLEPTKDILSALQKTHQFVIGFCVADQDLLSIAQSKLKAKNCDVMIANGPENIGKNQRSFYILKANSKKVIEQKNLSLYDSAYEILQTLS